MKITLINPNLIVQSNDPFTTGIVYMPITLAYVASSLREAGHQVQVIDAFAQKPQQVRCEGGFCFHGLTEEEVLEIIEEDSGLVLVYAINLTNHNACINVIKAIKESSLDVKIAVLENTQAVTAYLLKDVAKEFFTVGADFIVTGEGEQRILRLVDQLEKKTMVMEELDGIGTSYFYIPPKEQIADLDSLSYPAWDLFPLKNYWKLRFAHGPLTEKKYIPLLTSRGCPYPCRFCVIPATNNTRWRARSALNVVDEMQFWYQKYGIHEFHWEDVDPTVSDDRIREICQEILKRKMDVRWKLVSGTKVETIKSVETIEWMAKAGCGYISISPETGSKRVLKLMKKPFNLDHAKQLVKKMNQVGIKVQTCFVLGFPGEESDDRKMTYDLVREMTKYGVDEIALFIVTPVPGSAIYKDFSGFRSLSELNFTPSWREDYEELSRFRNKLYTKFLIWKLMAHPAKILKQVINFVCRKFETKMEMVPYRALVLSFWRIQFGKSKQ